MHFNTHYDTSSCSIHSFEFIKFRSAFASLWAMKHSRINIIAPQFISCCAKIFLSLILVDWSAKRVLWRAPGHVVIAEGSNEVDSSQKSLRQAKAFDSSKEKDTRERSVMGQEKSARGESTSLFLSSSIFTDHRALNQFLAFLSVFLFAVASLMVSSTNFAAPSTLNRDVIKMTIQSFHFAAIILIYHLRSLTCQRNSHFSNIFHKRKDRQSTVFENLRKKSHSTLRAKPATFTF